MNKSAAIAITIIALSVSVFSQKGIDTQTQTIKDESSKTTRSTDSWRSLDWGKGKTKVRQRLANPYKLNSRRDVLLNTITNLLAENKFVVDEASSRLSQGLIVTQPFVFSKGAVTTTSELNRYAEVPFGDTSWSRGQYSLTIEVQAIDGIQNNVSVVAKVEGRSVSGLFAEWVTLPSSGVAEDEFLSKLVETVTGVSPEPVQDIPDDDSPF